MDIQIPISKTKYPDAQETNTNILFWRTFLSVVPKGQYLKNL